jgi:hypothetical protein
MSLSYYVYYRIQPQREGDVHPRVETVLAGMAARFGVHGRLLRKRGEPNLWMEVYEGVPDGAGFETALAEAATHAGIPALLVPGSSRKVECFEG